MKKNQPPVPKRTKKLNPPDKVKIRQLPTGVRGLDEILGGGLPEYSCNHSKDIREFVITPKGVVVIGPRQPEYICLPSGLPERIGQSPSEAAPGPRAKSVK